MNILNLIINLKGNQAIAHKQLLKSTKEVVFVDDVCNFTDLTAVQVRAAFKGLIAKGLVTNEKTHVNDWNQYKLAY